MCTALWPVHCGNLTIVIIYLHSGRNMRVKFHPVLSRFPCFFYALYINILLVFTGFCSFPELPGVSVFLVLRAEYNGNETSRAAREIQTFTRRFTLMAWSYRNDGKQKKKNYRANMFFFSRAYCVWFLVYAYKSVL